MTMAGWPKPRRRVNPKFRDSVRACGFPLWRLARDLGYVHYPKFSTLVNARVIPDTPTKVGRLCQIADAVGFDKNALFLPERRV